MLEKTEGTMNNGQTKDTGTLATRKRTKTMYIQYKG